MRLHSCAAVVAALSLLGAGAYAAGPESEMAHRLEAIVRVHAEVPADGLARAREVPLDAGKERKPSHT